MFTGKIKTIFNKFKDKLNPKEIEISKPEIVEKTQSVVKQLKKKK